MRHPPAVEVRERVVAVGAVARGFPLLVSSQLAGRKTCMCEPTSIRGGVLAVPCLSALVSAEMRIVSWMISAMEK